MVEIQRVGRMCEAKKERSTPVRTSKPKAKVNERDWPVREACIIQSKAGNMRRCQAMRSRAL